LQFTSVDFTSCSSSNSSSDILDNWQKPHLKLRWIKPHTQFSSILNPFLLTEIHPKSICVQTSGISRQNDRVITHTTTTVEICISLTPVPWAVLRLIFHLFDFKCEGKSRPTKSHHPWLKQYKWSSLGRGIMFRKNCRKFLESELKLRWHPENFQRRLADADKTSFKGRPQTPMWFNFCSEWIRKWNRFK
jgi:hypothetical protein